MTSHVDRTIWRTTSARVRCPVVWEFLSHFADPMPPTEMRGFEELLRTLAAPRAARAIEWQRAAFLGDVAVREIAPVDLERLGLLDGAAELRALAPLRVQYDFRAMDDLFAHRPWEGISDAARSAATWASALGDAPAPTTRARRINGARAAGNAMQLAGAWAEGIEALRRVVEIT